jgi:NarL family two-component system response regulator LiaR
MRGNPTSLSIVLIHGNDAVRASVGRQLDPLSGVVIVASVRHADAGVRSFAEQPDAVVLIEEQPVDDSGRVALLEELRRINPRARVVMLADVVDPQVALAAVRSGVSGIVRSGIGASADVVRLVADGVGVFDADTMTVLVGTLADLPRNPLSARERQVLECLAVGMSNAEAAAKLFVSRETIKTHVAHVLRKLEVDDRVAAVDKATRIGLLA